MADKIKQEPPVSFGDAWNKGMQAGLELSAAKASLREVIAHRIKVQRLAAKMTQEELAREINSNFLTYRGYENCKSDIPLVLLIRIADHFRVSLDYLTGRVDELEPDRDSKPKTDPMEQRIAQLEKLVAELAKK